MLAGDRPFESRTEATIMRAIMDLEPPSLLTRRPDVPLALEQLISQTLAQESRKSGPASANELIEALRSLTLRSGTVPVVAVAPRPHASVAVLPFLNLSAEPDSEYFSDGLTEELIHALSRLPGLQVVSRTSAFEFKGKAQNVRKIGEQLKVSAVVEGSVRKHGRPDPRQHAAGQCERRLLPVVAALRLQDDRHLRGAGGDGQVDRRLC